MDDFCIRSIHLPVRVGEILCAKEPAVKSSGTSVLAMAGGAVLREQSPCVHFLFRKFRLLQSEGMSRGAAGRYLGQSGQDKWVIMCVSIYHAYDPAPLNGQRQPHEDLVVHWYPWER